MPLWTGRAGHRGQRGGCKERGINEEEMHKHTHTHTDSQAVRHKLDRGSCGDLGDICSMYPIDICVLFPDAFPFLNRADGTHTGSHRISELFIKGPISC